MSLVLLGILNSQAEGAGGAGAYDLLETQVLGSSAASVTFTGLDTLAAGYQHLQIRGTVRKDAGTGEFGDSIQLVFNSDTGLNYAYHDLNGNGSAVASFAVASDDSIVIRDITPRSGSTANIFGAFVTDILDFSSSTKNTTTRTLGGSTLPSGETDINLASGLYNNTSAITSIAISPTSPGFITGSRFSLYGVK